MRAWCVPNTHTHTHISGKSGKKNSAVVQVALRQQYNPECSISSSPSVQPEERPTPRLLLLSTNRLVFFSHAHSCWCPCVSPYFPINASPMLSTASGVLRCRDVCEVWECCIACMHQLLSGFIDPHAINHSKCTDLQLGCSGANAFFNKVDIGHTRAHHRRVSVTLACVNLERFLMRWEKNCTSVTAELRVRLRTVAVDTGLVCTVLMLYLYYSRLSICPLLQGCSREMCASIVCLFPVVTHRPCNTDCNFSWSSRFKEKMYWKNIGNINSGVFQCLDSSSGNMCSTFIAQRPLTF